MFVSLLLFFFRFLFWVNYNVTRRDDDSADLWANNEMKWIPIYIRNLKKNVLLRSVTCSLNVVKSFGPNFLRFNVLKNTRRFMAFLVDLNGNIL